MEPRPYIVPERVAHTAWDVQRLTVPQDLLLATHNEASLTAYHLEAFVLDWVNVLRTSKAASYEEAVVLTDLSARLRRCPPEHHTLARDGVLDLIA